MQFLFRLMHLVAVSVFVCGCSQKEGEKPPLPTQPIPTVHGSATTNPAEKGEGIVGVVKKQHLADYATTPVGAAIDSYRNFTKKEWSESRNLKGTFYVDFTGWLNTSSMDVKSVKEGVSARGVQIKFVIYENGSFGVAMVSKVEAKTDGKLYVYPLENSKAVLESIYANKEIVF